MRSGAPVLSPNGFKLPEPMHWFSQTGAWVRAVVSYQKVVYHILLFKKSINIKKTKLTLENLREFGFFVIFAVKNQINKEKETNQ